MKQCPLGEPNGETKSDVENKGLSLSCTVHVENFFFQERLKKQESSPYLAYAPLIVTVAIGILGWCVVERFARQRERRADLRELCKSFEIFVQEIVNSAEVYYQLNGASPQSSSIGSTLRAKIQDLSRLIEAMNNAGMDIVGENKIMQLRRAITDGDFDSLGRGAIDLSHPKIAMIRGRAEELKSLVRISFYNHFVPSRGLFSNFKNYLIIRWMFKRA